MVNTMNFGLRKPEYSDTADIKDMNNNMNTLDTVLQGIGSGLGIVANGNTHAAITAGQFLYLHGHASLADGLYKAKSNIAEDGALTSGNVQAVSDGGFNEIMQNIGKFYADSGTVYTSLGDLCLKLDTLSTGDLYIAAVDGSVASLLLDYTVSITYIIMARKASSTSVYYNIWGRDYGAVGGINVSSVTINYIRPYGGTRTLNNGDELTWGNSYTTGDSPLYYMSMTGNVVNLTVYFDPKNTASGWVKICTLNSKYWPKDTVQALAIEREAQTPVIKQVHIYSSNGDMEIYAKSVNHFVVSLCYTVA